MDLPTEIAIATIVGALHFRGRIDDGDVAEIVRKLNSLAADNAEYIGAPLAALALRIKEGSI